MCSKKTDSDKIVTLNRENNKSLETELTNIEREWVYCFTTEDGYIKIGKTNHIARRLYQLKKDGPFMVCFAKHVNMAPTKVKIICNLLSKYKQDNNLYKIPNINSVKYIFELMEGEWYNESIHMTPYKKLTKHSVCNEEMLRQYLMERKLNNLGGTEF
jgi:hypothetical protein